MDHLIQYVYVKSRMFSARSPDFYCTPSVVVNGVVSLASDDRQAFSTRSMPATEPSTDTITIPPR